MFSEYASRFLAQSQSRLSSFGQQDPSTSQHPLDRRRAANANRQQQGSRYLQRPSMGPSPYGMNGSQFTSRFPFAGRNNVAPAPLFYSATDEFREEDDGEEHEREVADFYALQRSRAHFGQSHLSESEEADDRSGDIEGSGGDGRREEQGFGRGRGIRSSWRGGRESIRGRPPTVEAVAEREESVPASEASAPSSKGKGKLVDVALESTLRESLEALERNEASGEVTIDMDNPPPFQQFRKPPIGHKSPFEPDPDATPRPDKGLAFEAPRPISPSQETDRESVPATVTSSQPELPKHDAFWASLYIISIAALFATFFLVWMHTAAPSGKKPLGDTIYTTLHSSFYLLAVYTLVATVVAALWLFLLRSFIRPLLFLILAATPIILFSFSLYPFIWSYKGTWHGNSIQDRVMRWLSVVPGIMAAMWVYLVYKSRHSFAVAVDILDFSCRILAANSALLAVGFAALASIIVWTWLWIGMFTRVFLQGHLAKNKQLFVIEGSTWWLGIFFVLVYLWTLSIFSGIQRATTAATVSQWYFHRLTVPAPSSRQVVQASFIHATSTLFGTICFSTFLSLAVRLPLLILPRRLVGLFSLCIYSIIPTPIATLTNPLTLTYAAIHSQPLSTSARGLSQMAFISRTSPTTTITPRAFTSAAKNPNNAHSTLLPYRLSKLLLHATRFMTSLAMAFGGWVSTARMLDVPGSAPGVKGSLYAYVVGLIAGAIGWSVLGAMEGVLGGIVDAVVVCWGSEVGNAGFGEARYCREAGELFGGDGRGRGRVELPR